MTDPLAVADPQARAAAEACLQRGLDHYDRQAYEQALECYQQAVAEDPTFAMGYNNLGMVLIDLELYQDAIQALCYAVQLSPTYGEAYNNLGFVLRRLKRNVEAAASYAIFLSLDPDVEEAPRIQGWVQQVMQELSLTALPELNLTALVDSSAVVAPVDVQGQFVGSDSPALVPDAAVLPDSVAVAAETASTTQPTPASIASVSAHASKAVAAPSLPPLPATARDTEAWVEEGTKAFAEDRLDEALKSFEQAVTLDPHSCAARTGLGKVLIRQEKTDEGIRELRAAVVEDPAVPDPYYVLGFALRSQGKDREAAEAYHKFLELQPQAEDAAKIRQWLLHVQGGGTEKLSSAEATRQADGQQHYAGASGALREATESPEDAAVLQQEQQYLSAADQQYQRALAGFQKGDIEQAQRASVKILTDDPAHFHSRVLLGRIHLRQKEWALAIEQLEGALITSPDYPEALYFLAQAYEKNGQPPKAWETYTRCLDVAPQGPRAERVRELLASQTQNLGQAASEEVQCELCLRFFTKEELKLHDAKNTCRSCLALIGGAPLPGTVAQAKSTGVSKHHEPVSTHTLERTGRRGHGVARLGILALLLLGCAWQFTQLPEKLGLRKPPVTVKLTEVVVTPPDLESVEFDPAKVSFQKEPARSVLPFAAWHFQPVLTGIEGASKDMRLAYTLIKGPEGMSIDAKTGALDWTPKLENAAALLHGILVPVEIRVQGTVPGEPPEDVFATSQSFTLNHQFGYVLEQEIDIGLNEGKRCVWARGDLNGDGRTDVILGAGRFAEGELDFFLQSTDNPLPAPLVVEKAGTQALGQIGALQTGDFNGDGLDDVVAASRYSGRVHLILQDQRHVPVPTASFMAGQGPVALCVKDLDEDGKLEYAVLLGLGKKLVLCRYEVGRFTAPKEVEVPSSGAQAWLLPWTSQTSGPGLLAVLPLAPKPLCFVPVRNGELGIPILAPLTSSRIAAGAALLRTRAAVAGQPAPVKVVLLTNQKDAELTVLDERNGTFHPSATDHPVVMKGLALALAVADWNLDGLDDVAVVFVERVELYLRQPDGFAAGPVFETGRLETAAATPDFNCDGRPDLLLITENGKARILMSKALEGKPMTQAAPSVESAKPEKTQATDMPRLVHAEKGGNP